MPLTEAQIKQRSDAAKARWAKMPDKQERSRYMKEIVGGRLSWAETNVRATAKVEAGIRKDGEGTHRTASSSNQDVGLFGEWRE